MALIKCKECGQMISDKASACPHCGCPVSKVKICEECGESLPENATECPNCGCPIEKETDDRQEGSVTSSNLSDNMGYTEDYNNRKSGAPRWLYAALALIVLAAGVFVYFIWNNGSKNGIDSGNLAIKNNVIPEGKYYVVLYKDNTGGLFTPEGGRICGVEAPQGRKEPLELKLTSQISIMGNNSNRLYASRDRIFSQHSDFISYNSNYNPEKTLGTNAERIENGDSLIIAFELQEGQIDKFNIQPLTVNTNRVGEYTLIYYSDETGDLFDDNGGHICGLRKGFGIGEYCLRFSKSVTLYGELTDEVIIDKGKVYSKSTDFREDRYAYNQQESKAKASATIQEKNNAVVITFSKNASSQGKVGRELSSSNEDSSSFGSSSFDSSEWMGLSEEELMAKIDGTIWTCRPVGDTWYRLDFRNGQMFLRYATPSLGHWLEEKAWNYTYYEGYTNDTGEKFVSVQFKKPDDDLSYGALMFFNDGSVKFGWLRGKYGGKAVQKDFNWD